MDLILWTEEVSETRALETMSLRSDLTMLHSWRKYFWSTLSLESNSSSSWFIVTAVSWIASITFEVAEVLAGSSVQTKAALFVGVLSSSSIWIEEGDHGPGLDSSPPYRFLPNFYIFKYVSNFFIICIYIFKDERIGTKS